MIYLWCIETRRSKKKVKTRVWSSHKERKIVNFGEQIGWGANRNTGIYPSIQSEQSLGNARGAIPIRDESPPIGLHLSPARTVTRSLFFFSIARDFRIPRQNNRPWKRLPGFLTPAWRRPYARIDIRRPILDFLNIKWLSPWPTARIASKRDRRWTMLRIMLLRVRSKDISLSAAKFHFSLLFYAPQSCCAKKIKLILQIMYKLLHP